MTSFVLASASPRRYELLARIGFTPRVVASDIDETPRTNEAPFDYVVRVAREKALAIAAREHDALILAADTTVVLGQEIFGKASTAGEARANLLKLRGMTHEVSTAYAIAHKGDLTSKVVTTEVDFSWFSEAWLDGYISCGEWRGKAGSYAIQGVAASVVKALRGSVTNVIGLPLVEVLESLEEFNLNPDLARASAV